MLDRIFHTLRRGEDTGKRRSSAKQAERRFPLPTTAENIEACFDDDQCVTCGAQHMFYLGPRGGAAQNMRCGCCGQKINVTIYEGKTIFGQEIGIDHEIHSRYQAEDKVIRDRHADLLNG